MPLSPERLSALLALDPPTTGSLAYGVFRSAGAAASAGGAVTVREVTVVGGAVPVPATWLVPAEAQAPGPAVIYCHAHGNRFDIGRAEATEGRPALLAPPLGLWLAERGYRVLCPELGGFGMRRGEGTESARAKAALWQGRTVMGGMLADLVRARTALAGAEGVDAGRIAALGLSMGATLAYWLAALDRGVAAVAHLCALADLGPLIATGAHDLHGPYMTVPGLLAEGDMGDVAALVAPRPQLVCAGLRDPLTPRPALDPALARLRAAYAAAGAPDALRVVVEPDGGHAETPAMRTALGAFLRDALA